MVPKNSLVRPIFYGSLFILLGQRCIWKLSFTVFSHVLKAKTNMKYKCVVNSLKVSNLYYMLPDSDHNPRNIQFSFAGAMIESYKVSPVRAYGDASDYIKYNVHRR